MPTQFRNNRNNGEYMPTKDVIERTADGREIVVARKGVPVPMGIAERYGLTGEGDTGAALGTMDTPVGNTDLMEAADAKDPRVKASIEEVESSQNNTKDTTTSRTAGRKGKTPSENK